MGHKNTKSCRETSRLTHGMDRYRWNILGLFEMRWKNFGETTTEEGHKVFFSGQQRKDTRFSSVEKRINTSMALEFLFTRTS